MKKIIFLVLVSLANGISFGQSVEEKTYTKALEYFKNNQIENAIGELNNSLSANPNYRKSLQLRAYYFFENEDYAAALKDCNKIIYHFPKDTNALQLKALLKIYMQDDAKIEIEKCINIDSNDTEFYGDLGYAYSIAGENESAKKYLLKALSKKQNANDWYELGYVYYNNTDYEEAIKAFENTLKLDKENTDALRMKAICLINIKNYNESVKIYETLLAAGDIREPDDFYNWGLIYYNQKKYDQALIYFQTPKEPNAELYYYMGLCYYKKKNFVVSLQAMQKASSLANVDEEENAALYYNKAIVETQSGNRAQALTDLYHSVYLSPEIFENKDLKGDNIELLGDAAKLLKKYYKLKVIDSIKVKGWQERSKTLTANHDYELALLALNKALAILPDNLASIFLKSVNEDLLNNYQLAINTINKAINLQQLKPDVGYLIARGKYLINAGDTSKALNDFLNVNQLDKSNKDAYYFKAMIFANRGKKIEAVNELSTIIDMKPEEDFYYIVRAYLYNSNNEFEKALSDCNAVIQKVNDNPEAFYQRGMAYWGLEKLNEAKKDLNMALELDPDMEEAREALEGIK